MNPSGLTWALLSGGLAIVVAMVVYALVTRRSVQRSGERSGTIWKRAYHLGAEIAAGRSVDRNRASLTELIESTNEPMLVAAALAVAVRQEADDVRPELFATVARTSLPKVLRARLDADDDLTVIEALEIVEVLRVHELMGDAAALTVRSAPLVVRAACDAVVAIEPSVGVGILIGLADNGESWVLDSLGRASNAMSRTSGGVLPLAPSQWRSAPMLARRALDESATFDRASTTDAISTLIGSLDDASSAKRLAAIGALSASIDHVGAQLALAGALGSSDRMTRYAVAASLSDTVAGRDILRRTAAQGDESDAARMAAEILWSTDADPREVVLHVVAS